MRVGAPGGGSEPGSVEPALGGLDVSRVLVGSVVFAVAVAAFARIPLLPAIGDDLSLSTGEIGLLTTAFGLGRLLTDLPAGRLAGAVSPRLALAGAGAGLALACGLLAGAGSFAQALVASGLIGCASALANTTGMYAFATATGAERRGASMAIYTTALMSGQIFGPALGGALGSLAGWRPAMGVAAGIGLVVMLLCLALRQRERRRVVRATRSAPGPGRDPARVDRGPTTPPPTRSELLALAAAPFATFFAMAGLTQTLVPLIGDGELELGASTIGLAIGAGAAARFASAWITGVGSDRLSRKVVLVPSLLAMALGAGCLALPPGVAGWTAAIGLIALGSSGISVAAAALADRVAPAELGHRLGMFRLVGDVGLVAGPIVAGFLYQAAGPGPAGGACAAVLLAAALAAGLWVRE
ncbi:MAG: MFS transporter, partial [Solirubrobacterales bacterium]|nr:MFS transporter [Solirubrobacterales bacterium]